MGKVHEALKKAEEEQQPIFAGFITEGSERRAAAAWQKAPPQKGGTQKAVQHNGNEFDFVDYSLNTPSASDLQRLEDLSSSPAHHVTREAEIDMMRIDPHLVTFYDFDPRASDQYNKMAATMISSASERRLKRVMIASAQAGDGRTCVALNLACALANAKQRVLVIDTDLYKPSALRLLGIETEVGMAEVIEQGLPAAMAAVKVTPQSFVLLPTRARVENPAQLLASPRFGQMLQAFDADYDFILFDSPPLLDSGDSNLLRRHTDATLMVVRSGKTNSRQLEKAIAPFSEDNIVGVVINRAVQ